MSKLISENRTRVEVKGADLRVTHSETSIDDVLSVLADARRRKVLMSICESSGEIDVSTLAERVADRLASERSEAGADATVHRLRVSLHHQHLPTMASAGLVEYDTENQRVEATDAIGV